ncbi:MAG: hypothetical protein K8J08_18055 [Thermoanaerobaculia bacterium]|nr:hypothetical protein [Thermoanaerobaculia bacterium]
MPSLFSSRRFGGVAFDLICAAYFWRLAAPVTEAADVASRDPEGRAVWLGVLLLLAIALETWALPVKLRQVRRRLVPGRRLPAGAIYLLLLHIVVAILVLFVAMGAFGWKVGTEGGGMPWPVGILTVVMVLRGLALGAFLLGSAGPKAAPLNETRARAKERAADLGLTIYACLAYSATWGMMVRGVDMASHNPIHYGLNLVASGLTFLAIFLPLRIPYLVEEWASVERPWDWLIALGSIGVAMASAIASL